MRTRDDMRNEPICKFGPGGDYISVWPDCRASLNDGRTSTLARLLKKIAEMAGTAIQAEFCPNNTSTSAAEVVIIRKEGLQSAHDGPYVGRYAASNGFAESLGGVRTQPRNSA